MTLDPQVKAILDQMAEAGGPKISDLSPTEARVVFREMSTAFDNSDVPVGGVEDRSIPGPGGEIPIRLYTPVAAGGGPLAALVFYHGGGWVIGDLESHDATCRTLSQTSGCKVIAVDYRLAPEHKFPAAADDAYAALTWVEKNAMEIGVDPNRIAVGGDSAGGNLAAAVCLMSKDKNGPHVAFQLLIYPVAQIGIDTQSRKDLATGYFLETETMIWFEDQYMANASDADNPYASPLKAANLSGLPPAYVITAGFDPLKDEGKAYADNLRAAGVDVQYVNYDGMIHGFVALTAVVENAANAVAEAGNALKKAMK